MIIITANEDFILIVCSLIIFFCIVLNSTWKERETNLKKENMSIIPNEIHMYMYIKIPFFLSYYTNTITLHNCSLFYYLPCTNTACFRFNDHQNRFTEETRADSQDEVKTKENIK